jgi:secreted trypsin-like serine protease
MDIKAAGARDCRAVLGSAGASPKKFCAGARGKDLCWGDSGGPVIQRVAGTWTLVGLAGWSEVGRVCDTAMARYTRVSRYAAWITKTIRENP